MPSKLGIGDQTRLVIILDTGLSFLEAQKIEVSMTLFVSVLPSYSDVHSHDWVLHEAGDHAGRRVLRFGRLSG